MEKTSDTKLYEVGYLVMPILTTEAVSEEMEIIKKGLLSVGAEITEEGSPKQIPLGYPMSRRIGEKKYTFQDGFFGWIRFNLVPAKALAFKEIMDKRTNLLRYLTVTVDEKAVLADIKAAEAKLAHREAAEAKAATEATLTQDAPEEETLA